MTTDVAMRREPGRRRPRHDPGPVLRSVAFAVAVLVTVFAGIWVGNAVTDGTGRSELGWSSAGYPATAIVVDAGPITPIPGEEGWSAPRGVSVRWSAPDGSVHRGEVVLPAAVEVGARVPVLVGADGVPHPQAASSTRTVGFVAGVTGALLGWMAVWAVGIAAGALLKRHRAEDEERNRS